MATTAVGLLNDGGMVTMTAVRDYIAGHPAARGIRWSEGRLGQSLAELRMDSPQFREPGTAEELVARLMPFLAVARRTAASIANPALDDSRPAILAVLGALATQLESEGRTGPYWARALRAAIA